MLTVAQFLSQGQFLQFEDTPEAEIQARLNTAYRLVGEAWGDLRDDGASYYAAHLLALDPRSESSAKAKAMNGALNFGSTHYLEEYKRLLSSARAGFFGTTSGC